MKIPGVVLYGLITIFPIFTAFAQVAYVDKLPVAQHPRLLFLKEDEIAIRKAIVINSEFNRVNEIVLAEATKMIQLPVLERKQIGRRLLSVSREAIRRIMFMSYAYRITNDQAYALATEKQMLAIAAFENWNPTHFLDVAEMTLAMGIGYDWLYNTLSPSSKAVIKNAIVEKGLRPSLEDKYNYWLKANHNWNQVCNGGLTFGALAVYDEAPALAKYIINRAIESIKIPMAEYAPDGAYPEGPGYWGYGTSYNVLFLSALEKNYKTDFGLSKINGFLKTADYMLHVHGVSGITFNYSDNGAVQEFNTAMFWFAEKLKRPELIRNEMRLVKENNERKLTSDRFLPSFLVWGSKVAHFNNAIPDKIMWVGGGLSPVAFMRTSWTDMNAVFLGFKAGAASVNHAHMDVGSFIMEADGERWAMDFGVQNYQSLESKGIRVFGTEQYAQRWTIFRFKNTSHNTLTFNDSLQRVSGRADIDKYSCVPGNMFAISNLSEVYKGAVKKIVRGVALKNSRYVLVQDEIETSDKPSAIRWSMVTPAEVKIVNTGEIQLTKSGKILRMYIDATQPVKIKTWATTPETDYDAENPGTTIIGFETELPANTSARFVVSLVPAAAKILPTPTIVPLEKW